MTKVIGLLNLHNSPKLGELNITRSVSSTSFLGRYAFMDFPLSNFSNSGIDKQAILVEKHLRSIIQHIGSGHAWNENTKIGGLTMLYDEPFANTKGYNHDVNNLLENSWYLKDTVGDVVVIVPSHIIYQIDFRPLIEDHVKNHHRISVIYHKLDDAKSTFIGEDIATIDERGFLRDLNKNQGIEDKLNISMQTYIIDKEVLKGILQVAHKTSSFLNLRDTLKMLTKDMPIYTYEHKGYIRCFDTIENYFKYSLELLNYDIFTELFNSSWEVYTKTYDTPPAKYGIDSDVTSSFIANGCIVKGKVKNSVLARDVIIEEGAEVENCVILSGSYISENTHLKNVVCDKEARILHEKDLVGEKDKPQFIRRGDIV
ncbi:MAG: glucose-1-phosphate adenylyltransferase subunit GlgD [Bacilli bacterium]|nr:glucose-1-phosphate adenylyltransferase subunit GlgD [Bacilli bacterium]